MRGITEFFFGFGAVFIDAASFRPIDRFLIHRVFEYPEIIEVLEEELPDLFPEAGCDIDTAAINCCQSGLHQSLLVVDVSGKNKCS